ncbi:hypothetical protein [endosymbiont GvMRE of Glomus versiforme]|uniref:hypothetical protein n=1 Tax=endosymbiont GvMRE of Glomus versiforme TaxID=2039283 RepID=UPI000EDA58D4|nr:hypothetical protein [endosymbiont GvMRE of Glomus versiforme]RHZ36721.1 hypothetical protein GvMRE_I2g388 [endosymbiont GvMRE of Glomus versiforme]
MTKYKLEEFKTWLEEKPERKENLDNQPTEVMSNCRNWETVLKILALSPQNFEKFLVNKFATHKDYIPFWQVTLKWKQEVDQREREREREREQEGGNH